MVNKMTLFSILCLFFTSFALKAQITQGELEIIKSELHKGKKELVKENMNLVSEEAAVFWPIYNEYQNAKTTIMDERIGLLQKYSSEHLVLKAEEAKEIANKQFQLSRKAIKLRQKYFNILSKKMSPIFGFRFMQIERQIDLLIELKVSENLPLMQYR